MHLMTLPNLLAFLGGLFLLYQAGAVVTKNMPLRAVVNPYRRKVLLAGTGCLSLAYLKLSWVAWSMNPPDVWAALVDGLGGIPGNLVPVLFAAVVAGVGGLIAGPALFCYAVYPPAPNTFWPRDGSPGAKQRALLRALRCYTNQRGGLGYAGLLVTPANGAFPTATALLHSTGLTSGTRLFDWLDRRDSSWIERLWGRPKPTPADLDAERLDCLGVAVAALAEGRTVGAVARGGRLGDVEQLRVRTKAGGVLVECLLSGEAGQPSAVFLFGVTRSVDEVGNGRLELHFEMLRQAVGSIVREPADVPRLLVVLPTTGRTPAPRPAPLPAV